MAHRLRRSSMERLRIFDLDNFPPVSSVRSPLPPPLPPPRKSPHPRVVNPIVEHSKSLYDQSRFKRDPIYAATPMFTVVPQQQAEKQIRHILGARVPPEIVRRIAPISPTPPLSTPKSPGTVERENGDDEKQEDDDRSTTNDNDSDDDKDPSSSSSSSDDDNDGNDILNDGDDDKKGVVEQIINRNKRK